MDDIDRISDLIAMTTDVPRIPGADDAALSAFERRCGFELPLELRALLRLSNGPNVRPGGLFGIDVAVVSRDIESTWTRFPVWRERGWIPIAKDGCGNYYLTCHVHSMWPLFFVEGLAPDTVDYVVASRILVGVIGVLEEGAFERYEWPFDESEVVENDPDILSFADTFNLPWSDQS